MTRVLLVKRGAEGDEVAEVGRGTTGHLREFACNPNCIEGLSAGR